MAYLTTSSALPAAAPWRWTLSALRALGNGLERLAEAHSRRDQIERLSALSDAQLQALGLRRDQIVAHVFRDRIGL